MNEISRWIVLQGRPVFSCRTRKQARQEIKRLKKENGKYEFRYVGKVYDSQNIIVLTLKG